MLDGSIVVKFGVEIHLDPPISEAIPFYRTRPTSRLHWDYSIRKGGRIKEDEEVVEGITQ